MANDPNRQELDELLPKLQIILTACINRAAFMSGDYGSEKNELRDLTYNLGCMGLSLEDALKALAAFDQKIEDKQGTNQHGVKASAVLTLNKQGNLKISPKLQGMLPKGTDTLRFTISAAGTFGLVPYIKRQNKMPAMDKYFLAEDIAIPSDNIIALPEKIKAILPPEISSLRVNLFHSGLFELEPVVKKNQGAQTLTERGN